MTSDSTTSPAPRDASGPRFNPHYLLPDTRIGAYLIRERINSGGGQVAYLAHGPGRGPGPEEREVVLKMSLSRKDEPGSEERLMHERFRRQLGYLLHLDGVDGVAQLITHGMYPDYSNSGHMYLVQEWVPGNRTILTWAAEEPRPLWRLVRAWLVLADACAAMGRHGISHRDLTDDNVLVTPEGIPKIIDFDSGVSPMDERFTVQAASRIPGKYRYYSPELCKAILQERLTRKRVPFESRPTADLYAMGVIFYRMLTGEYPFNAHLKGSDLFAEIAHSIPPRPRELNPEVSSGLETVTLKLLEKEPEKRYRSGDEVVSELTALSEVEDWRRPFQTPPAKRHPPPRSLHPEWSTPDTPTRPDMGGPPPAVSSSASALAPRPPSSAIEPSPLPPVVAVAEPPAEGERQPGQAADGPESAPPQAPDSQEVVHVPPPVATGAAAPFLPDSLPDAAAARSDALPAPPDHQLAEAEAEPGASVVPPPEEERAPPRPSTSHRRWMLGLAAVGLTLVVAWSLLGPDANALLEKGKTVLTKAQTAMVAVACSALGCAELSGRVRPQDEDWFAQCPAKSRKVWREDIKVRDNWAHAAFLNGPNLIRQREGAELRTGPVEVIASMPGLTALEPTLHGHIHTGSDGASIRLTKMKLADGREFDICGMGVVAGGGRKRWGPGIPIMPAQEIHRVPDSQLHPKDGFIYVMTDQIVVIFAK